MNGGDTRTPRAQADIAKREQQIVALKLRGIPTPDIARVVGVSRQGVNKAFKKALRRQTEDALDAWHRTELGKLAMEETNIWRLMDIPENKSDWKAQAALEDRLLRIHIRRARLLGLDAPNKFDVRATYGGGSDEAEEGHLRNQRAWASLSRADQERLYEALKYPAIETTATVNSGTDDRTDPEAETED